MGHGVIIRSDCGPWYEKG